MGEGGGDREGERGRVRGEGVMKRQLVSGDSTCYTVQCTPGTTSGEPIQFIVFSQVKQFYILIFLRCFTVLQSLIFFG